MFTLGMNMNVNFFWSLYLVGMNNDWNVLMNYVVQMAPSFMPFLVAHAMCSHICLIIDAMFWHNDGILNMNMNP
jgi:hypothetical protein